MNAQMIGFAPGTLAIWFCLFTGIAACLVYFKAMKLAPAGSQHLPGYGETLGVCPAPLLRFRRRGFF